MTQYGGGPTTDYDTRIGDLCRRENGAIMGKTSKIADNLKYAHKCLPQNQLKWQEKNSKNQSALVTSIHPKLGLLHGYRQARIKRSTYDYGPIWRRTFTSTKIK